jgi:hypothetical protein
VKFINNHEMNFIHAHRNKYPDTPWNSNLKLPIVKPSPTWFTPEYSWLRAVRSNNRYGLVCIDCAEFASSELAIKKNQGAFVVRPYWKSKHKGLEGKNITLYNHKSS